MRAFIPLGWGIALSILFGCSPNRSDSNNDLPPPNILWISCEDLYPQYRGEIWGRYRDWIYPMFIGFALDQVYLNCGLEIPQ